MLRFKSTYGVDQKLSPEHRVLFYPLDGGSFKVLSALEITSQHETHILGFRGKFATTFTPQINSRAPFNDAELRVMVMVIADGTLHQDNRNWCALNLKKPRKIKRACILLESANISYKRTDCKSGYSRIRFNPPKATKTFGHDFWKANLAQLHILADEIPHWDSCIRKSGAVSFSSYVKSNADFAQYVFAATGRTATLSTSTRSRRQKLEIEYVVHARKSSVNLGIGGSKKDQNITWEPTEDGFKYCFEVPSTFLLLRRNGCIFATGNTGKTRTCIEVIKKDSPNERTLILCPKSITQAAWQNDIFKFAPGIKSAIAEAPDREKAFTTGAQVIITNWDAAKWLSQNQHLLKGFTRIIGDESTAIKNRQAQRSVAVANLARLFEKRIMMSGTPAPQGVEDLWHQAFVLDFGQRLGSNFFRFLNATHNARQRIFGYKKITEWEEKEGALEAVSALLADITIRNKLEDCLDMPENRMYEVPVTLSKKHQRLYDQVAETTWGELKKGKLTSFSHQALRTKLLQIASGAVYTDNEENFAEVDTSRYELIADLADARPQCLIAFNWRHQRDGIIKQLNARNISFGVIDGSISSKKRIEFVQDFQTGVLRVGLLHPASAGHGLTLTEGHATIWASPTDNLEHFEQLNRRIYRAGQTKRTETILICAQDTLEPKVYEALINKSNKLNNLLELMQ